MNYLVELVQERDPSFGDITPSASAKREITFPFHGWDDDGFVEFDVVERQLMRSPYGVTYAGCAVSFRDCTGLAYP